MRAWRAEAAESSRSAGQGLTFTTSINRLDAWESKLSTDEHGLWILFGTVLLQQFGLPIPAFPLLMLAGAQTFEDPMHGLWALVLAVVASSLGNYAWFLAGRHHGHRVLNAVCRVSLSPGSCVRQAENAFNRYGLGSLVLGRFVPGLGIVAPPLAGSFGVTGPIFLLYNGIGSALWGLSGLAALEAIPRDREVVVYCACPNEATAARIALQLQKRGLGRIRPLAGGIDAWEALLEAADRKADASNRVVGNGRAATR